MLDQKLLTMDKDCHDLTTLITTRLREKHFKFWNKIDVLGLNMDLAVCYNTGLVNLGVLLGFPDSDFIHDIVGITNHMDRETGKMTDCFVPRSGVAVKDRGKTHNNEAGYVAERINPLVPTKKVVIYIASKQKINTEGTKYAVVCDAHAQIGRAYSIGDARHYMKNPENFCLLCRQLAPPPVDHSGR